MKRTEEQSAGRRTAGLERRLFPLAVVLIVYASLFPWRFDRPHRPMNPVRALLTTWPRAVDRFHVRDAIVNLVVYVPVGALGFLAFRRGRRTLGPALAAVAFAALLSGTLEVAQFYIPERTTGAVDLVMNTCGAAAGVLLAVTGGPLLARAATRAGLGNLFAAPDLVLLVGCWAGYLIFPPVPALSRTALAANLTALWRRPVFSPVEAVGGLIDWLSVALLLDTAAGGASTRTPLALLMALLPVRLFLAGHTLNWTDLAAAAGAFVLWEAWVRAAPGRVRLLAGLVVAALVLRGFAPFRLTEVAAPFSWAPFQAALQPENATAVAVLLKKCFLYGTAAWLVHAAGRRWVVSAASIASLLAVIEIAQTRLAGRTPEVTDPLLAVLLAALLASLAERSRRHSWRKADIG